MSRDRLILELVHEFIYSKTQFLIYFNKNYDVKHSQNHSSNPCKPETRRAQKCAQKRNITIKVMLHDDINELFSELYIENNI
jgi:hypothetical protein